MSKASPYHETYTGPDERLCEHCGTPLFQYFRGRSIKEHDHMPLSEQCQRIANRNKAEKYDDLVKENDELKRKLKGSNELVDTMSMSNITPPQRNRFQMQQQFTQKEIWKKQNDIRYGVQHI